MCLGGRGYRGRPPRDVEALADANVRVGALVEDPPGIVELDLNPSRVDERGATIVDARAGFPDSLTAAFGLSCAACPIDSRRGDRA
jgi:acyl-CoA synthetase (NDP forming)